MVPDPFVIAIVIALGFLAWAVFRMCTCRDLHQIDASDSPDFEETYRDPQDEARGRGF